MIDQWIRWLCMDRSHYRLAVAGYLFPVLAISLAIVERVAAAPANDNFNNRIPLSGVSFLATGNNLGGTKEANEPNHGGNAGGNSVWWSWTAPFTGGVALTTHGSDFDTTLGVYTGTAVSALTFVTSDGRTNLPASVTFKATSGTNYKFAVDGIDGASGNIHLSLALQTSPPTDSYSNATTITSGSLATGINSGATREGSEPNHAGLTGGKSVWWTWTPTSNSCVTITTEGSDFDTLLGVYNLVSIIGVPFFFPVASNDDARGVMTSSVSFNAVAGSYPYAIAVDGYNRASGNIVLRVLPFVGPTNNFFTNATVLTGTNVTVISSNLCASKETGEPDHHYNPGGKSLWWRWQAPASGGVTIDISGSDFPSEVAIYTGTSVSTLTPVASGNDHAVFKVTAGTTYRIAVDGTELGPGNVTAGNIVMKLAFHSSPANDNFANRTILGGGIANGSNIGATLETGEPQHAMGLRPASVWGRSVWWTWTSVVNGPVSLFARSSNFVSVVEIYSGSALTNLTRIAGRAGTTTTNELPFVATFGTVYQIAVDGNFGAEGYFTLNVVANGTPGNNNFANATAFNGTNGYTFGRNTGPQRRLASPIILAWSEQTRSGGRGPTPVPAGCS